MGFFRIGGNGGAPAPKDDAAAKAAEAERQRQLAEQRRLAEEARQRAEAERRKAAELEKQAEAARAAAQKAATEKKPGAEDLKKAAEWADVSAIAQQQRALDAAKAANAAAGAAKVDRPFPEADQVKDVFQARGRERESQKRLLGTDLYATPTERAAQDARRVEAATTAGPDRGAQMLDSLIKDNPDPEYRTALVDASKASLARISASASGTSNGAIAATTADALGRIQGALPPEARATFDQALKTGAPDGKNPLEPGGAIHKKAIDGEATEKAKAVEDAYAHGGAAEATAKLKELSQTEDKDLVDAIIARSQPTLGKVAEDLAINERLGKSPEEIDQKTQAIVGDLAEVSNHASDQGAHDLARPIAEHSFPDQTYVPEGSTTGGPPSPSNPRSSQPHRNAALDALTKLDRGQGVTFLLALSDEAKKVGKPQVADKALDLGFEGVKTVQADYEAKKGKRDELDGKLAKELSELKGTLTPEQQQAYAREFHQRPENKKVYDAEIEASRKLNDAVGPHLDALTRQAQASNRQGDLVDVMKSIAGSSTPQLAAEWAMRVTDKDSPDAKGFAGQADAIRDEVLTKAIAGVPGQAMLESGGDTDAAGEKLSGLIDKFRAYQDKNEAARNIQGGEWLDAIQKGIKTKDWSDLKALSKNGASVEGLPKSVQAFAAAGLGFAILGGASAQDAADLSQSLANGTKDLLTLTAGSINRSLEAGRLLPSSELAQTGKLLETKWIPGLSLFADAIGTAKAWDKLQDGGNAGDGIAFVGNALGLVADVAEFIPVVDVAAPFLKYAGLGITAIGDAVSDKIKSSEFDKEQTEILQKLWKDDPYFKAHPERLTDVTERLAYAGYDTNALQQITGASREQLFDFLASSDKNNQLTEPVLQYARIAKEAGVPPDQILGRLNDAIRSGRLINANSYLPPELSGLDHLPDDPALREKIHQAAVAEARDAGLL